MNKIDMLKDRSPFRPRARGYKVAKTGTTSADVFLYDEIGFWGVQAKQFIKDINALKVDTINLRINSPGGDVFDGASIYNALKRHSARVVVHIDGLAASMASAIAMAGDEIRMAENAFMMIHHPWTIAIGNAEELRKHADVLDKIGEALVNYYSNRTGKDPEEISAAMAEETWFNAEESVEYGLADLVEEQSNAKAYFDLSVFNHVPEPLQNMSCEMPDKRTLEAALRDAGCSRTQAARVLSKGYEDNGQRDAGDVEALQTLSDSLTRLNEKIRSSL